MSRLNYHHLRFFWTVAREGSIARACVQLHLTQPTISGHLRELERSIGAKLFARVGRNLVLSDIGREVFHYANEIFTLGEELEHALNGNRASHPARLLIGVADTLPKEIAYRLIEPALRLPEPVHVVCENGPPELLVTRLSVNSLDVVLADAPVNPSTKVRAFNHLLGECGLSFMGAPDLVAAHRRGFPKSLDGAPMLLPAADTVLRRSLEQWFADQGVRPRVCGEFSDPGLLKVFGQNGAGLFPVRTAVEEETKQQYTVRLLGRVDSIRERFYVISVERKLRHPAVVAMTAAARERLFAS
jgi:LysR family transcriptional activator of nhaA